jgi:tryptophan synthase alpha chain
MIDTAATANAVDSAFERARSAGRLAFMPYLTAGYPSREESVMLARVFGEHGADVLEIGIPFSDPLGDGPTIQRASSAALAGGMTVRGALDVAAAISAQGTGDRGQGTGDRGQGIGDRGQGPAVHGASAVPLVAMGYVNPLLRYGFAGFCADAAAAGIGGLIVPDLPVEESDELLGCCRSSGVHLIYLLAPTSTEARIAAVVERASGFIYCMAVTGVTGARDTLSDELAPFLARVRARTSLPLVVGFGISRPEHVARLHGLADGVVVASALIDLVDATPERERAGAVAAYVERMSAACSAS